MSQDNTITVYSDYICPFCYLGRKSLEEYQQTRTNNLTIDWHPFDLRSHKRGPDGEIDHSINDGKDEEYFDQVRQNVAKLKERYGADEMLSLDDLPDKIDSFDAQVASLYVDRKYSDKWLAFDEAIFEALWINGNDIGDADVLARIADDVGLDGEEIRSAISNESNRSDLREKFNQAQQAGVTGVPTFVYDSYAARGAVPPEQLERLIEGN
ncbi:MAG: DsbA family protein [Halobacteriaceae archaeon]